VLDVHFPKTFFRIGADSLLLKDYNLSNLIVCTLAFTEIFVYRHLRNWLRSF